MHVKSFLLDWDTNGQNYFEDISISSQVQGYLHFYVFYRSKELPAKLLPQFRYLHVPKNTIITPFSAVDWKFLSTKLIARNPRVRVQERRDIILVSSEPQRVFSSLIEILNGEKASYKTAVTKECTLMDEFQYKCDKCRMIFRNKKEVKKHDERFCGFFEGCLTQKQKRKIGFSNEESQFQERVCDADKCDLCTANCVLTYCPHRSRKEDMKMVHKTTYVGKTHPCWSKHDTNEFSAHFLYGYDALPCLAVTGCARTFRTLQEQAHHHVTEHGCHKPYFCIVCYKLLKVQCFDSENELLFHGKLEGHCEPEFSFA
ncbi:hypothetical protein OS493_036104 [Desmophyllum pertusum]|uniref:4Fe-4S ferredoxin-type domain-containing protein n=1 Tax=Desmophyllum pertusum TaxID=174260 RepID=A0A9W9YLC6_9CNID|nr:hypothetical protein OS493_036104 [Desmophyllum pertusum]